MAGDGKGVGMWGGAKRVKNTKSRIREGDKGKTMGCDRTPSEVIKTLGRSAIQIVTNPSWSWRTLE